MRYLSCLATLALLTAGTMPDPAQATGSLLRFGFKAHFDVNIPLPHFSISCAPPPCPPMDCVGFGFPMHPPMLDHHAHYGHYGNYGAPAHYAQQPPPAAAPQTHSTYYGPQLAPYGYPNPRPIYPVSYGLNFGGP